MTYRRGQRVRVIRAHASTGCLGREGTVTDPCAFSPRYGVCIRVEVDGVPGPLNHGWLADAADLEPILSPPSAADLRAAQALLAGLVTGEGVAA